MIRGNAVVRVRVPGDYWAEREYAVRALLEDLLGLHVVLERFDGRSYRLEPPGGETLVVEDHFWSGTLPERGYVSESHIPRAVQRFSNEFTAGHEIPVLFGSASRFSREGTVLTCPIDIFAGTFFMLSRWEETIPGERDIHGRFPAVSSLAYKAGFLDRPIINEYADMLWRMLVSLSPGLEKPKRTFRMLVSCDVDQPYDWTVGTLASSLKASSGDLLRRGDPKAAIERLRRHVEHRRGDYGNDPNFTFPWYLDTCERYGHKAAFFFIADGKSPNNGHYRLGEEVIRKLFREINRRGHEIGVHGSYESYNDARKIEAERKMLCDAFLRDGIDPRTVMGYRQHYLRWDPATTPAYLDRAGYEYDSSGAYADAPGFKYGVCHEFRMWDCGQKKALRIRQKPLIIMERTILSEKYLGLNHADLALAEIDRYRAIVMAHEGEFTLLWHNSNLHSAEQRLIFEETIKHA